MSEIVRGKLRHALGFDPGKLILELKITAAKLGELFKVAVACRAAEQKLALLVKIGTFLFDLGDSLDVLVVKIHVRARLVDQVDGLVGEEAVGDVALGKRHGHAAHLVGDLHAVEVLVVLADALENLHAVVKRWLGDGHGLEAAFQRGVLFDVLAVFGERRCADDLNLAAGERGLENVRGVHAALGVARADEIVYLVDDEDDISLAADLLNESLHARLKLAAELRSCDERGEIEQEYLLVAQLRRHIAGGNTLRKTLGDRRLADARLADEAGIVFLTAVKDLNDALELFAAADHAVELARAGTVGERDAVVIKKLALALPLAAVLAAARTLGLGAVAVIFGVGGVLRAEKPVEERERCGFPVVVRAVVVVFNVHEIVSVTGEILHGLHHFAGKPVKLFVIDAHFGNDIVDGLDVQLTGALETQSLLMGLTVFDAVDEYHRHVFVAAGTESRLHRCSPVFCEITLYSEKMHKDRAVHKPGDEERVGKRLLRYKKSDKPQRPANDEAER